MMFFFIEVTQKSHLNIGSGVCRIVVKMGDIREKQVFLSYIKKRGFLFLLLIRHLRY